MFHDFNYILKNLGRTKIMMETTLLLSQEKSSSCWNSLKRFFIFTLVIFIIITFSVHTIWKQEPIVGAVVSNGPGCAKVGIEVLKNGGSAADAAISTLLCESLVVPQSLGVGGGFIAVAYDHTREKVEALVARETAPGVANEHMFGNVTQIGGPLACGVPSLIAGFHELHSRYGRLPWYTLFEPAIKLCHTGFPVSKTLERALRQHEQSIRADAAMKQQFFNPETQALYREGEYMKRPDLAKTLRFIASDGYEALYSADGKVSRRLIKDIRKMGGIITEQDLMCYKPRWENPVQTVLQGNKRLYTAPLPASGDVLAFILNVVEKLVGDSSTPTFWQRVVETFKHAYAHRASLGDMRKESRERSQNIQDTWRIMKSTDYIRIIRKLVKNDRTNDNPEYYGAKVVGKDDHGTANIAVLAPDGSAITATATINSMFGSKVMSRRTGIILNDEMDDFSTPGLFNNFGLPPSAANFIKPHKCPMSSMCPTIVLDEVGNVRLLMGGAGGSKIITSVAQGIIRHLMLDEPIDAAICAPRLHHQLLPMHLQLEPGLDDKVLQKLLKAGHKIEKLPTNRTHSSLTAIAVQQGEIVPFYDPRRSGSVAVMRKSENKRCRSDLD